MMDKLNIDEIIFFPSLELNHSSYLITAIQEFALNNQIDFRFKSNPFQQNGRLEVANNQLVISTHTYPKVCFIQIRQHNRSNKLLAFDLHDSNVFFSTEALIKADYYLKRTYTEKEVKLVSKRYSKQIYPMGIPFMLRPEKIRFKKKLKNLHLKLLIKTKLKIDREIVKNFKKIINLHQSTWNDFINTRSLTDFEKQTEAKQPLTIFYQKRFFPHENNNDAKQVHQQRIAIVRLLKENFPNHFVGGIKDDVNLPKKYKDCASSIEGAPVQFLKAMQDCAICIYTRGLANSIGWTLPEFMSQGKAIIAEKQDVMFPEPIVDNKHVMYFETIEELSLIISNLIKNPNTVKKLSKNARQYYEEFISPKCFFKNTLDQINA